MIANWARNTSTTTGTGNLTLSSVTGYPPMSAALPLQMRFAYAILDDATGAPFEAGIGYLSDANTLVREAPLAKQVSGTFTQGNATTPASLAAGTKRVIVTQLSQTAGACVPVVGSGAGNKQVINAAINQRGDLGYYNGMDTSGRLNLFPWLHDYGGEINGFRINVITAQAGKILRIGLYGPKANGDPGPLLAESASIDLSTTGFKNSAFTARVLSPGWYYLGLLSDATTVSLEGSASVFISGMISRPAPWGLQDGVSSAAYALGVATTTMPNPCPAFTPTVNMTMPHVIIATV